MSYYKTSDLLNASSQNSGNSMGNTNSSRTMIENLFLAERENYEDKNNDHKNNGNKTGNKTGKKSCEKVELKWKTVEYKDPTDPQVWGSVYWFMYHLGSAHYPINPSPITQERMKGFILGLPVMVTCEKCSDHATAYIESNYSRLDEIVSSRENLFKFFVDMHNMVNKRYNKPVMSYDEAYKLYTGKASVSKLSYSGSCSH